MNTQATGQTDMLPQPGEDTAYDSLWAAGGQLQEWGLFERVMLAQDKLFVVLAVVLIIWIGIVLMVLATDRKIRALERTLDERHIPSSPKSPVDEA